MTYATLLRANLTRNLTRTLLTGICLIVAFLLFGLLQPIGKLFHEDPGNTQSARLMVTPRHSIADMLPVSHYERIEQLQQVDVVAHATWFGGTYVDAANFFPQYVVSPEEYLAVVPEIRLLEEQRAAFVASRQGAIVGRATAERFQWQLGDRVSLIPNIWHNRDAGPWEFEVVGIFDSDDSSIVKNDGFYVGYDYFDSYRAFGNGTVGSFAVRPTKSELASQVATQIDALFANSDAETTTLSENEYALSFAKQMGDIGTIVSAILASVFFTISLLASNTVAQTTRERIPELAVMRTLGFSASAMLWLVLLEAILLTTLAAGIGLLLAQALLSQMDVLVPQLTQLGSISISNDVAMLGLAIALLIGLAVGLPPALRAIRIKIVDALRV